MFHYKDCEHQALLLLGALAFDKNTGFWIISSIPRFPAIADRGYIFANQQTLFGQITLCVTVLHSEKQQIGNNIFLNLKHKPLFINNICLECFLKSFFFNFQNPFLVQQILIYMMRKIFQLGKNKRKVP